MTKYGLSRWLAMPAAFLLGIATESPAQRPGGTGASTTPAAADATPRRPDFAPRAYAIKGAKVVAAPGKVIENATVVVRDGVIEAVGAGVEAPYDAEVIEGKGLVVYAGFLDLYSNEGQDSNAPRSGTGLSRPIPLKEFAQASTPPDNRNGLTPEFQAAEAVKLASATAEARRKLGFTDLLSAPEGSVATGQSALVSLSGLGRRESIVASPVALHIALANPRGRSLGLSDELLNHLLGGSYDENCAGHAHGAGVGHDFDWMKEAMAEAGPPDSGGYPGALMGVVAHLRQAMLDADHHKASLAYFETKGGPRPPFDPALEALAEAKSGKLPTWWEADTEDQIHRALDLAEEFGTTCVIVGGREADKVADRLKDKGVAVVLKVDLAKKPEVPSEADYKKKSLKERDKPLRVLAEEKRLWEERAAVAKVLAEKGIPFAFATDNLTRPETFHEQVKHLIDAGLPADKAVEALTIGAARLAGLEKRLGTIEPGKLGHLVAWSGDYGSKDAKVKYVLIDGQKFEIEGESSPAGGRGGRGGPGGPGRPGGRPDADADKPEGDKPAEKPEAEKKPEEEAKKVAGEKPEGEEPVAEKPAKPEGGEPKKDDEKKDEPEKPFAEVASELEEDRKPGVQTGGDVLIKDVTILTVTKGTIPKGSILIRGGKIAALGADVEAPEGVLVIDGAGMVAAPGIIDTHSHMAISGGVNDGSLSLVPEIRVKDVVTGADVSIYRAAAGGATAARLLHGSANTIGGQDAVIKLRYGKPARDLILKDGPQGIKFALGENVTQKRSSNSDRFPFTRMGVEAVLDRAFLEAVDYKVRREAYAASVAKGESKPPFRRDLRLEALADILDGKIKVHSHSYRSDEILMLLRTAERFGFRVRSLQHVLEGYKLAPEIAAHGASCSTFSDWWAYKVEAYDAIPYNAALLTKAGVSVCIKSDSDEEIRHLNLEAAKMVRYGGLTEDQAMALVTINPARELGLDHRLGSLEVGKDADLALYDAHPLDGFAACQLTLVDGEIVFQKFKGEEGAVVLKPRPGSHEKMPRADEDKVARKVEIEVDPAGVYALTNATIHPVSGPEIAGGTLVVSGGKIAAVGGAAEVQIPGGATTVDLGGLDVWPGMIDAGSIVGLSEIESISATRDMSELAPFQPELKASVAINPESALIPVNRAGGVLSSFTRPTGGTIAGQGALIDLAGWVYPEMVQKDDAALYVNLPPSPPANLEEMISQAPAQFATRMREQYEGRDKRLKAIKDQFAQAKAYAEMVAAARSKEAPAPAPDPRMSALAPYARGEKLVVFNADGRSEILQALEFAKDLKLKAVISGGGEAWKVAEAITEAGVPVIIQGTQRLPGGSMGPFGSPSSDPYDALYANPAKLAAAGVVYCIASSGEPTEQRNLPFEAASAAGYGLSEEEALKAVTLYPAKILGVEGTHGSLEVGKRANLVITAGHLLQPTSEVKMVFVGGRPIEPTSRHTEFYEKYSRRQDEVAAGIAPLGLDRKAEKVTAAPAGSPAPAPADAGATREERR
jgi:imidazolonepropionase-like amidohydrolase